MVEFDNRSASLKGDYYILDKWYEGNITFKSGELITGLLTNYDLENDQVEVKYEDMIKVIPLLRIDNFVIADEDNSRLFMPCENYNYGNGVLMAGVCEVLDSNYFGLIIKYTSEIKEATYVPALDMGKKEDEIILKKKYFLTIGKSAYEIPGRKQLFAELYAPYADDISLYLKKNKLNPKDDDDLHTILNYLNSSEVNH